MEFEWFEEQIKRGAKRNANPTVTISKNGGINFNKKALEEYNINESIYIIYGISEDKTSIGFNFVAEKKAGAYKINIKENGASASIKRFLEHKNIVISSSTKFPLHQENDFVCITLTEGETSKK
ncbi:hypothetical protein [Desulfotalea psychrophila]|uniref:Uncharacterized protein n=1 Tax=Desulfotalea psychrophila (strain LSv54 / DSM 12343) TaxID=177439 RepID=Q6AI76_DESPS|nr:hypothetical protein [Desulfotalea psychrophila]CAG37853.1 unknown protein [Desulfotalea psychrophila LSv54]